MTSIPTRLILVRHGETEANVAQIWQGSLDAPLTEIGRLQVAATAELFRTGGAAWAVTSLYASPLPRARSTALAIGEALQLPVVTDKGLREFDLGEWEGRSFADLRDREGLWERWDRDPAFAPPGGESPLSFNRRAEETARRLAGVHPGETILLVTHGGIICNLLANWIGAGPADWRHWEPGNCAVSVLEAWDSGWRLLLDRSQAHLPPQAVVPLDQSHWAE